MRASRICRHKCTHTHTFTQHTLPHMHTHTIYTPIQTQSLVKAARTQTRVHTRTHTRITHQHTEIHTLTQHTLIQYTHSHTHQGTDTHDGGQVCGEAQGVKSKELPLSGSLKSQVGPESQHLCKFCALDAWLSRSAVCDMHSHLPSYTRTHIHLCHTYTQAYTRIQYSPSHTQNPTCVCRTQS